MAISTGFSFQTNMFCHNRSDRNENIFISNFVLSHGGQNVRKKAITRLEDGESRTVKIIYNKSDFEGKTRSELELLARDIDEVVRVAEVFKPYLDPEQLKKANVNEKHLEADRRQAMSHLNALGGAVKRMIDRTPIPKADGDKKGPDCEGMPAKTLLAGSVLAMAIGATLIAVGILFLAGTIAAPIVFGVAGLSFLLGLGLGVASIVAFVKNAQANKVE